MPCCIMSVRKGPGGAPPSAEGETKKKPVSKNDFLTALKEEVHQKKFQRDQIVGELAKLDYNHQRESLEDQNDVSEAISEIHLNSAISPLAKVKSMAGRAFVVLAFWPHVLLLGPFARVRARFRGPLASPRTRVRICARLPPARLPNYAFTLRTLVTCGVRAPPSARTTLDAKPARRTPKAVVPDMLKSRHTLNRERKDQLLRDLHKIEKQIDKLHETIDAIAPKKHHYYCVDTYQYEKWFGECCAEYFPDRQDPHNDQKFMPEEVYIKSAGRRRSLASRLPPPVFCCSTVLAPPRCAPRGLPRPFEETEKGYPASRGPPAQQQPGRTVILPRPCLAASNSGRTVPSERGQSVEENPWHSSHAPRRRGAKARVKHHQAEARRGRSARATPPCLPSSSPLAPCGTRAWFLCDGGVLAWRSRTWRVARRLGCVLVPAAGRPRSGPGALFLKSRLVGDFACRVLCAAWVLAGSVLVTCRCLATPRFLRQKCANMPTSTQQVERHSFRFPGPFAH